MEDDYFVITIVNLSITNYYLLLYHHCFRLGIICLLIIVIAIDYFNRFGSTIAIIDLNDYCLI
jgi:hypothetical protein